MRTEILKPGGRNFWAQLGNKRDLMGLQGQQRCTLNIPGIGNPGNISMFVERNSQQGVVNKKSKRDTDIILKFNSS